MSSSLQDAVSSPKPSLKVEKRSEQTISLWRIFLLCAAGGAIDAGYVVEGAYAVPLILESGLSLRFASIPLALSPILGLLSQSFLGAKSDQCRCKWGRRRPFIVLFSLTAAVGFGVAPNIFYLQQLHISYTTILIIVGVTGSIIVGDFGIGGLLLPSRAYLMDILPPSQISLGNFVYSAWIGLGSFLGASLGGIKWSWITGGKELTVQSQGQIVFGLTSFLIIVCTILTICSVKERPYIKPEEQQPLLINERRDHEVPNNSCCDCQSMKSCSNMFIESFQDIFTFIYNMSYHMWMLWLMLFFGDYVLANFNNFFTEFVGTIVYDGNPSSPVDSESYHLYTEGLRMGSWGLAIASFCNAVFSLFVMLAANMNIIDLKILFLSVNALFTISSCLLMYFHQVPVALALATTFGPMFSVTLTAPYVLVSIYKVSIIIILYTFIVMSS